MLQTLIIDKNNELSRSLESSLKKHCPALEVTGVINEQQAFVQSLSDPDIHLYFINPNAVDCTEIPKNKTLICISDSLDFIHQKTYWDSVAYLLYPIKTEGLIYAVKAAREKIKRNQQFTNAEKNPSLEIPQNELNNKKLIGIPTIEGFEIIALENIVRCEGLQKCTRIITTESTSIVSSYSIGMYKKLLACSKDFFASHRSHLVNLNFVSKFRKAGEIVMKDQSVVPISKSCREEFLSKITRL